MKVAIVTDWLVVYAGAEKVLEQILNIYPDADLFSVVDFLPDDKRDFIKNKMVTTTFIQKMPFAKKKYRSYLPLMPMAIEQLDVSKYDIVISSSSAVAKGIITGPDQLHICYCHSPIRYAWDLQHQYLREAGLDKGMKSWIVRYILHRIRTWDTRTSNGVDVFIANSGFIGRRIWKVYRRKSKVIYPPVDIDNFTFQQSKKDFYVTASRMVPYKKIDMIVEAFAKMPDKKLFVIGDGPDFNKIKEKATDNVILLGYQSFSILKDYLRNAKAFVFAAEEDFGIAPVEAQACGTPVIAYGKGGVLESIKGTSKNEHSTGIFYYKQTVESLIEAVENFEREYKSINSNECRINAMRFSNGRFRKEFKELINNEIKERCLNFDF